MSIIVSILFVLQFIIKQCQQLLQLFIIKRSGKDFAIMNKQLIEQNESFQIYNPFMNPPSIKKAYEHQSATRVGIQKEEDSEANFCDCCGNPIQKKQIPFDCNEEQLLFLGSIYPIFFKLVRYFGFIVLIVFIMSASAFYLFNTLDCQQRCMYIFQIPIINLDTLGSSKGYQSDFFHFCLAFVILIISIFIKRRIQDDIYNMESMVRSPEQYTIIGQNFPQEVTEQQIIDWSKQKLGIKPIIINFVYSINQLLDAQSQKLFYAIKLNKAKIRKNQAHTNTEPHASQMLSLQIKDLTEKIVKYDRIIFNYKRDNVSHRKLGTVLLTYSQSMMTINMLNKYEFSFFSLLLDAILSSRKRSLDFQGRPIIIKRAPAPRQIIWENLAFSFTRYILTSFFGFIIMILAFFLALKLQLKLALWFYSARFDDQQSNSEVQLFYFLESIAISLTILLMNLLFRCLIKIFINLQKHYSYSRQQSSFCLYYSVMYILNTCFMIYIAHNRHQSNPDSKQLPMRQINHILIYDIHLLMLLSAFSEPIYKLINPIMWGRVYWRRHIESLPPERNPYTQAYVNQLWQEYSISNVDNYHYIFRTLIVSIWFSQAAPLGVLVCLFGLFSDYWITKFFLLRMYKKPQLISHSIAQPLIKSLPFLPMVYLCGVLEFNYQVSDSPSIFIFLFNFLHYLVVIVILVIGVSYYLYGKAPPISLQDQVTNYATDEIKFIANYDTENPLIKVKEQEFDSNSYTLKNEVIQKKSTNFLKQLGILTKQAKEQNSYGRQYYRSQETKQKKKVKKLQTMQIQLSQYLKQEKKKMEKYSCRKSSSDSSDYAQN